MSVPHGVIDTVFE
jgi:hypothetical protein